MTKAQKWLRVGGAMIGGDAEQEINADVEVVTPGITVPASSTDYEIDVTMTFANAKAYAIVANKDCTVKTNSTSSPAETLTLKANQALVWCENDPAASHFLSVTLTKIYVTTTDETVIKFGHASDITPA